MEKQSFVPGINEETTRKETKQILKKIGKLQYQMMAEGEQSLLLILQGLDASGKDGLTDDLLRYCNPVGLSVTSFKKPSREEYAHDFLWRVHREAPAKGQLKVFIRSHYEDILVPTVLGLFPEEMVEERYKLINHFEKMMAHGGTKIVKCYLNVSPQRQEERLRERLCNPKKFWKHNDGDWDTRAKTDDYLAVYERIFARCNNAPWHNIPADTNWQKLYFTAQIVLKTLEGMNLQWPPLKTERFGSNPC